MGVARASQIVSAVYAPDSTRARIAAMAPEVLAACDESPEDAARLLPPAGAALAETVAAVARSLGWPGGPLPLAAAGSFLLSATAIRQAMLDDLAGRGYQPALTLVPEPTRGAVILAGRALAGGG
jgi:N-acetylglucosamine kinase-like BadF-type ATPase